MMKMSVLMNCMIPLVCHFMTTKKEKDSTKFLMSVYDLLLKKETQVDIYNKLYETAISNILRTEKRNQAIWNMQDIRGINTTIHAIQSVQNIIVNIMPKYLYNGNLVHLNYKSIIRNTSFQILDIEYEYSFVSLSSSKRDEDMNSEFDRYDSFCEKADEALLIQNQVASDTAMATITNIYGPFDPYEIQFYKRRLSNGNKVPVNSFQKNLIFNIFFDIFGDTNTINAINLDDYITLMISAKRKMELLDMGLLSDIISSKVIRLASRKNVNKKELTKLESSPLWKNVQEKYKSAKLEEHILSVIATVLSSEFEHIDPYDEEMDGQKIPVIPEILCEQILMYISQI